MTNDDDAEFFPKLEDMGEPKARAMLKTHEWGTRERQVIRWLELKDHDRRAEEDARHEREVASSEHAAKHAARAADAGEIAAKAAADSADTSKRALIVSVIALLISFGAVALTQCSPSKSQRGP